MYLISSTGYDYVSLQARDISRDIWKMEDWPKPGLVTHFCCFKAFQNREKSYLLMVLSMTNTARKRLMITMRIFTGSTE